ncbi:hypothetical protein SEA_KIDNEYBEAN_3 [Gordonia phage KidneyBean]|uniref:Uncharacterized protein n=1 Tax=Gordonia phage KidneyBean TaxID=2301603 RepID=A0A385UDT5_9CAUD|nr:hypothetical protein KNU11_gp03 [Gordonia phage KidneyBean]AYB69721.1 hypothetical protein SEA_KIDNEYBEAN_3 [Gordonia phage KidneyBean]
MISGNSVADTGKVREVLRDILRNLPFSFAYPIPPNIELIVDRIASDNRIALFSNEGSDAVSKKAFSSETLTTIIDQSQPDRIQQMRTDGDDNFFAAREDQVKAANTVTNALVRAAAEFGPWKSQVQWRKIAQALVTHPRLLILTIDMLSDEEIKEIYTAMGDSKLRVDVRPWDAKEWTEFQVERDRLVSERDRATAAVEKAEKERQEAVEALARERRVWENAKRWDKSIIADLDEQIRAYQRHPKPTGPIVADSDPFERMLKKIDEVREGVDKILAGGGMPKRFVAGEIPDGPVGTFIDGRVHLAVNPDGTTGEVTFGTPTISDEAAIAEPQERDRAEDNLIRKVRDVVAAEFERELYDRHTGSAGTTGFDFGTLIAETLFTNDLISVYDEVDQEAVEELVDGETEIVETAIDDRIDVNRGDRWQNEISMALDGLTPESAGNTAYRLRTSAQAAEEVRKLRDVNRAKASGDEWRHAIGMALRVKEPMALGLAEATTSIRRLQEDRVTVTKDRVEILGEPGKVRSLVEDAVLGVLKDDYLREHGHSAGKSSERAARMAVMANQAWFRLAENLVDD